MTEQDAQAAAGRLLRALASANQAGTLYPAGHPERLAHGRSAVGEAAALVAEGRAANPTVFVAHGGFYLGTVLLPQESLALGPLAAALAAAGIESLTVTPEVAAEDVDALVAILHGDRPLRTELGGLRINAVRPAIAEQEPWERKLAELRRAYASGVTVLRRASAQAVGGEELDLTATQAVVEQLYDQVADDPGYGLLLSAVKSYDEYTYFHMVNVCLLSVALGQLIGLRRDQVVVLGLGGLLHDIGKVFVPQEVLTGTGRLDEEQWRLVQRHPVDGAGMLLATGTGLVHPATSVLLEHHAAYDGSGYPGLTGHGPSVPSRLVAVADCFDAVTSKRTYRQPMSREDALALLGSSAGSGLDPQAVAAFRVLLGTFPVGSLVELSTGERGVVVRQRPDRLDQPDVLVLFDATGTPVEVQERDLASGEHGPQRVVRQLDAEQLGVDLPRFVASGRLHELPQLDVEDAEQGPGLVHEPSPGEEPPSGYVDTHAEEHAHSPGHSHGHSHGHDHGHDDGHRIDPDVAPPIEHPGPYH